MALSDELNGYLQQLGVTAKALAAEAGIPPSTLSRYLSGDRAPASTSDATERLAEAIARLSGGSLDAGEVARSLRRALTGSEADAKTFSGRFGQLLDELGVNGNRLALALGFDPSYISRMRTGQRRPANVAQFSARVARFVAFNCTDAPQVERIAALVGAPAHEVASHEAREERVREWLASGATAQAQEPSVARPLSRFLATLDAFDLPAFMEEIRFEEIRVPTLPFQLPTRKTYTGIDEMKRAELDFYRAAILSKSTDDVYLYSDMPLAEMAQDREFPKRVMKSVALLIRKGARIVNIHDVHRPVDELFMGLEGWVPVYTTGLMDSYYLPAPTNTAFLHFLRSAGGVACAGEAIRGDQGAGRYVLTKGAADVAYYRTRATQLLAQARPLLRVFTEEERDERDRALDRLHGAHGDGAVTVGEGGFSTLSITALPGRYVLISKSNPPAVDMLVEHPALVDAFERYEPTLF